MSFRISRFIALPVALVASLLGVAPAAAESSVSAGEAKAGASLQFRVVIPPVVRVTANDHPPVLARAQDGAGTQQATQRLAFHTNLRRGLCVDLQLADPRVAQWEVHTDSASGATLSPAIGGWRLCVSRPGQHDVTLHHAFTTRPTTEAGSPVATAWPVQLQLAAL
jgi:hypothetical protein